MSTDKELIDAICHGTDFQRDKALRLFIEDEKIKSFLKAYVSRNGGVLEDTEDLLQETLITFYKHIRNESFRGESSLHTFFIGIAKWHWYGKMRRQKKETLITELPDEQDYEIIDMDKLDEQQRAQFNLVISPLGEKCKKLLMAVYDDYNYTYKKLEDTGEFSGSAEALRKDVSRCRSRLHVLLGDNLYLLNFLDPILKNDRRIKRND